MAFLRIVRPYQPVDPDLFVHLGPSHGRVTGHNYGGAMAVAGGPVSPRILPAVRRHGGDDRVRKDPDNGAVKATEYRGPR